MSRWNQAFTNSGIKESIEEIYDILKEKKESDLSNIDEISELLRAKKILSFLKEGIDSGDPEYIPIQIITSVGKSINDIKSNITIYSESGDIRYIRSVNDILDSVLSQLKPFHPLTSGKAKAVGRAFSVYSNSVQKMLQDLEDKSKKINDFYDDIFNGEDCIYNKLHKAQEEIESMYNDIKKSYEYVFSEQDNEGQSRYEEIETFYNDIVDLKNKIDDIKNEADEIYSELEDYFKEIFGDGDSSSAKNADKTSESSQEGLNYRSGKSKELDTLINNLKEFEKKSKKKYEELLNQINNLLPGATSAGLATSFKMNKESYRWGIYFNSAGFFITVSLIFAIGFSMVFDFRSLEFHYPNYSNYNEMLRWFLPRLAMAAPLVWLAIILSKRRNQYDRLRQEYVHKEAVAASYESFKRQIEELEKDRDELLNRLMSAAIDAISYNAASTLDKNHSDSPPLIKPIERFIERNLRRGLSDKIKDKGDSGSG